MATREKERNAQINILKNISLFNVEDKDHRKLVSEQINQKQSPTNLSRLKNEEESSEEKGRKVECFIEVTFVVKTPQLESLSRTFSMDIYQYNGNISKFAPISKLRTKIKGIGEKHRKNGKYSKGNKRKIGQSAKGNNRNSEPKKELII